MKKNLPNRKLIRLSNWDYRTSGSYFITICTKDRKHYFGKIKDSKMIYTPIGAIADVLWYEMKNRNKNVELGEYVIMPDHMHGILILQNNPTGTGRALSENPQKHAPSENFEKRTLSEKDAPSEKRTPSEKQPPIGKNRFQNIGKNSVSSIIGGYKSAVTKHANRLGLEFGWQSRFHERIIRDEQAYKNITAYIYNNPLNWGNDNNK